MSMDRGAVAGTVQRVLLIDGRPYVELLTDIRHTPRAPVVLAGGGPRRFSYCGPTAHDGVDLEHNPLGSDASQVVTVPREASATTFAAGALPHIGFEFVAEAPEPGADEDHDGTVSILDNAMVNEGSKFILDHRGQVVLVVHDVARVQLAQGGVLRISRDGKAEERLPLAGPLIDYLQQLEAHVVALTNWAAGLVVTTPQGNGVPATPFARTPPTLNPAKVRSAALKVPADAG